MSERFRGIGAFDDHQSTPEKRTAPTPRDDYHDIMAGIPRCVHGAPLWACNDAALTRREPLDVERLARALHVNVGHDTDTYDTCPQTLSGWHRQTADILATEYARLEAADKP